LILLLALGSPTRAQKVTLRFATAAPDGTSWARALKAVGRDIEEQSRGEIVTKWYFGGIAGDEMEMLSRLERGQIDVAMSGGMLCMRLSPAMRVLRLLGLFQSREETAYVLGLLRPIMDAEFAQHGLHLMATAGLGSDMLFTRTPITSMADLRRSRIWFWELDDTMRAELKELGVPTVPLPLDRASGAYDRHEIDGFLSVPAAALAFQWSAQSRYLSGLRLGYLPACMIVKIGLWDSLTIAQRQILSSATARGRANLEELGRAQDDALLGRLFAKQGLQIIPASETFKAEFFQAARDARDRLRGPLIPHDVIEKVTSWLADYRAAYGHPRN
jgi:TRAP-type C4-dicarboxylate transport system substrate-binding protein